MVERIGADHLQAPSICCGGVGEDDAVAARIDLEHYVAEGIQQRLILGAGVLDLRHLPFQPCGELDTIGDFAHHADGRHVLAGTTRRPAIAAFHVPDRAVSPLDAQVDMAHCIVRRSQVGAGGGGGALQVFGLQEIGKALADDVRGRHFQQVDGSGAGEGEDAR